MKYAGYIGTVVCLGIAGIIQMQVPDEFVRFVSWTVPATIAVVSWGIQLFMTWKRIRKSIIDELIEKVTERVVDEMWNRIDTITALKKRADEAKPERPHHS